MKYNVICDSGLRKNYREEIIVLARKYNYEIIEINLEADYKILSKRFDERVKAAKTTNTKISNTSKKDLRNFMICFMKIRIYQQ